MDKRQFPVKCPFCNVTLLNDKEQTIHRSSNEHRLEYLKMLGHWFSRNKTKLSSGKHGANVKLKEAVDNMKSSFEGSWDIAVKPNEQTRIQWKVSNDSTNNLIFRAIEWIEVPDNITLDVDDEYQLAHVQNAVAMPAGCEYDVTVTACATTEGAFTTLLVFQFRVHDSTEIFFILREMIFRVHDDRADMVKLLPIGPYKRTFPTDDDVEATEIVKPPNVKIKSQNGLTSGRLKQYEIPFYYSLFLKHEMKQWKMMNDHLKEVLHDILSTLEMGPTIDNHREFFRHLMFIEQAKQLEDIAKYSMKDVPMTKLQANCYYLEVPGLAEKRPSILKGDIVMVRIVQKDKNHDSGKVEYHGRVVALKQTGLNIDFLDRFSKHYSESCRFDVRFTLNLMSERKQHRALEIAKAEEDILIHILFPDAFSVHIYRPLIALEYPLQFYNKTLTNNPEQVQAVRHIVAGSSRPAPYLIFGPPGTGKTVTMVEAIKQVWYLFSNSHILVCAASNSAANLLAERLLQDIPEHELFRMYAASKDWQTIPSRLKSCCNYDEQEDGFYYPDVEKFANYRIIVCTLITAGRLPGSRIPNDHFSHIFIDEGGQAIEPELLVAVAGILGPCENEFGSQRVGGQLVVGGDPKQLGAVLSSTFVKECGLDRSYLERVMETSQQYKKDEDTNKYDSRVLTKLLQNFRSHPAILYLPNKLFYDNELQACGRKEITHSMIDFRKLRNKHFPIIFHGVEGRDLREKNSPSFYNPEEVMKVKYYLNQLLNRPHKNGLVIQPKDIGIISPYRKQVQKIQQLVNGRWGMNGISVGSTEEFQGQERQIIIISTVRSSPQWMDLDKKYVLGFLCNPKRFNVAITRAQALLIIIGNPILLSHDKYWKELLAYCCENDNYIGCSPEPGMDKDHMEALVTKLESMQFSK